MGLPGLTGFDTDRGNRVYTRGGRPAGNDHVDYAKSGWEEETEGDFNAHIGVVGPVDEESIGRFGRGTRNSENGEN